MWTIESSSNLRSVVYAGIVSLGIVFPISRTSGAQPGDPAPAPKRDSTTDGAGAQKGLTAEFRRSGDLPPGAIARIGSTALRMSGEVFSVAFSRDSKMLASGNREGTLCLWNPTTGEKIRQWEGLPGSVSSIAFSPSGKALAALVIRLPVQVIRTFDVNTGLQLEQFEERLSGKELERLQHFQFNVRAVGFSSDGKSLMSFTGDDKTIRRRDVRKAYDHGGMAAHEAEIRYLALTADGKHVVSAGLDYRVSLREAYGGDEVRRFQIPLIPAGGLEGNIIAAAFSPDTNVVALSLPHYGLCLWDVATGKKLRELAPALPHANSLAFSPDGHTLAAASCGIVTLWDAATGEERIRRSRLPRGALALSPDGRTVAAACVDGAIRVWDIATGHELRRVAGRPVQREVAGVLDSTSGKVLRQFIDEPWMNDLSFSPDGKYLAGASSDKTVYLWESSTLKLVRQFVGHSNLVLSAAFSPTGKELVSSGRDDTARRWDVATGRETARWKGHEGEAPDWRPNHREVLRAIYSADGKSLALMAYDMGRMSADAQLIPNSLEEAQKLYAGQVSNDVRLLDIASGSQNKLNVSLRKCLSHTGAFCPDGKTFVSIGFDGAIRLWDLGTGKELRRCPPESGKAAKEGEPWWKGSLILGSSATDPVAFSPNGKLLAIGSSWHGSIVLFEVATGKVNRELRGHLGGIHSLAFSADGRLLASGSHDSTVLVWDIERR